MCSHRQPSTWVAARFGMRCTASCTCSACTILAADDDLTRTGLAGPVGRNPGILAEGVVARTQGSFGIHWVFDQAMGLGKGSGLPVRAIVYEGGCQEGRPVGLAVAS